MRGFNPILFSYEKGLGVADEYHGVRPTLPQGYRR
jgi:hypothetical protein